MFNLNHSSILRSSGITASKKLGQNFLNDPEIVRKIVSLAYPLKDEYVLEIGPGLGTLTQSLLAEPIAKLIAVEYDKKCVEYLRQHLLLQNEAKFELLNEDALKLDEGKLEKGQKLVIISNLPYNISNLLLLKWLEKITLFKRMVLMFQKEVAERICSGPNSRQYGIISVLTQYLCVAKLEIHVPSSAFHPQPKVDSAVISIVPKENLADKLQIYKKLELLCKTVFNKRRKTLRNAISALIQNPEESLLNIGIDPNRRPETLSIKEFESIASKLEFY